MHCHVALDRWGLKNLNHLQQVNLDASIVAPIVVVGVSCRGDERRGAAGARAWTGCNNQTSNRWFELSGAGEPQFVDRSTRCGHWCVTTLQWVVRWYIALNRRGCKSFSSVQQLNLESLNVAPAVMECMVIINWVWISLTVCCCGQRWKMNVRITVDTSKCDQGVWCQWLPLSANIHSYGGSNIKYIERDKHAMWDVKKAA